MASTYSSSLAIELIGTGEQSGTWGTTTNTNLGTLIEQAISGYVTQAITDGSGANTTITIPNGATGVARNMFIEMTGALTFSTTSLIVPANKKMYFIFNNTSGGFAVTVKVSGQTGILVPNGKKVVLTSNGTDIVEAHTAIVGNATMGGTLGITGTTTAAAINASGTVAMAGAATVGTTLGVGGTLSAVAGEFSGVIHTASAATVPLLLDGATTGTSYMSLKNTSGVYIAGVASSTGGPIGAAAYDAFAGSNAAKPFHLLYNAGIIASVNSGGLAVTGTLSVSSTSTMAAINASGDFNRTQSVDSVILVDCNNTANTSGASSRVRSIVGGSSASDPVFQWVVSGITSWYAGIDNSASDQFVIASDTIGGASDWLKITTAGAITIPGTSTLGAATNPVLINNLSDGTTYGLISFNGVQTTVGALGIYARALDKNVAINAITGGSVRLRVQGTDYVVADSTGLSVTGTIAATGKITVFGSAGGQIDQNGGAGGLYFANTGTSTNMRFLTTNSSAASQTNLTLGGGDTPSNSFSNPLTVTGTIGATGIISTSGIYIWTNSGTATPAGGAANTGFYMGSAAIGIHWGSGAPTIQTAKGSLYLRTNGTGTNDRMYVNTDGNTAWTAVVTVA